MDRFAATCEEIQRHANPKQKAAILDAYLTSLNDQDRALAEQFLNAGPMVRAAQTLFEIDKSVPLKIGHSILMNALRTVTDWDKETLRVCRAQVEDTGETICLLLRGISAGEPMSLGEADQLYRDLHHSEQRVTLLADIFRKYQPLTLKYFVKTITRRVRKSESPPEHAHGTLDVVITAAEQGVGPRATYFTSYTLGVRAADGFVNVGKAHAGLSDAEVKDLTRALRAVSLEKFGRALLVKPEIVVEVAFEGIKLSPRSKSGYALRVPRILRWRKEKRPEECASIEQVAALY